MAGSVVCVGVKQTTHNPFSLFCLMNSCLFFKGSLTYTFRKFSLAAPRWAKLPLLSSHITVCIAPSLKCLRPGIC